MSSILYRDDIASSNDWQDVKNPVFTLVTDIKNQVIDFFGYIGRASKIVSRIDQNLIEQDLRTIFSYNFNNHFVKPFSIVIERQSDKEYLAKFEEAGIVVSGQSIDKAISTLKEYIVELYDIFRSASRLGPDPQRQLSVLEGYIV